MTMIDVMAGQLRAVAELVGGKPAWRERLRVDEAGLRASFAGPALVVLLLLIFEAGALKSQAESAQLRGAFDVPPPYWPSYFAYACAYAAKTFIFLGAVVGFSTLLRARGSTAVFIIAHNWLSALVALIQVTPFAFYVLGAAEVSATYSVYLVALAFSAYARWRCAREALGVDRQVAVALAAGEMLLYLFAIDAFENAFGVGPPHAASGG